MADYYGVPVPEDAQVTRRRVDNLTKSGGIDKIVKASREHGETAELTEVYETQLRPVRLLNDVIDQLQREEEVVDLTLDPDSIIKHRGPILLEGEIGLSGASKIATFVAPLIPMLLEQLQAGASSFELDRNRAMAGFAKESSDEGVQVFEIKMDSARERFVLILNGENIVKGYSFEDLTDELAVFGRVSRIVKENSSFSLDKYLLPGLNRTLRRFVDQDALAKLTTDISSATRETIDPEDLVVRGPAYILDVAGIYT